MSPQSFALQCRWHARAWERNRLIRVSDRLEALSFFLLLLLTVVAIPYSTRVADDTRASTMRIVDEQSHTRHSVTALVTQGSTALPTDFSTPPYVQVQWREAGLQRTERIVSPTTVNTGAELTVWLDQRGRVVPAPLTAADASINATGVGWAVWLLVAVGSASTGLAIRRLLDRVRIRGWDRALHLLALGDDGWANRHR